MAGSLVAPEGQPPGARARRSDGGGESLKNPEEGARLQHEPGSAKCVSERHSPAAWRHPSSSRRVEEAEGAGPRPARTGRRRLRGRPTTRNPRLRATECSPWRDPSPTPPKGGARRHTRKRVHRAARQPSRGLRGHRHVGQAARRIARCGGLLPFRVAYQAAQAASASRWTRSMRPVWAPRTRPSGSTTTVVGNVVTAYDSTIDRSAITTG